MNGAAPLPGPAASSRRRRRTARRLRIALAAAASTALAVAVVWLSAVRGSDAPHGGTTTAPPPEMTAGPSAARIAAAATAREAADPSAAIHRVDRLWFDGSLRGSTLDGDWGLWVGGTLQPGLSLRRRFDHLLTAIGEVGDGDLRLWIDDAVRQDKGAAAVPQVLAVWDRYVALQKTPLRLATRDPAGLAAALAERRTVRRRILGPPWAEAFYAEEERAAMAFIDAAASTAAPAAPAGDDPASWTLEQRIERLGPEAAARLQAEDAAWAAWEARIAQAREALRTIAAAPQLSAVQRAEARERYLRDTFTGTDRMRAEALGL